MRYRGVSYKVVRAIDVHICWRWSLVINDRRKSGQTKISRRAAEIQAQSAIDRALAHLARSPPDVNRAPYMIGPRETGA